MPGRATLPDPVLSLAPNGITKLDSIDADNLSCMWNVFTKCKENLENGRRLENLSWRLWYREALMYDHDDDSTQITATATHSKSENDLPELSRSIDSIASEATHVVAAAAPALTAKPVRPTLTRNLSSKRHLTPESFHKLVTGLGPVGADAESWKAMAKKNGQQQASSAPGKQVTTVKDEKTKEVEAIAASVKSGFSKASTSFPADASTKSLAMSVRTSAKDESKEDDAPMMASSVVRGFELPKVSALAFKPSFPTPVPVVARPATEKKFFIKSTPSDSETDSDAERRRRQQCTVQQKKTEKRTSFKEEKEIIKCAQDSAIASDSEEEEDEDDDGAVFEDTSDEEDDAGDEDDGDWEDSEETGSVGSSVEDRAKVRFGKSERPGLPSRRSMLSALLVKRDAIKEGGSRSDSSKSSKQSSPISSPCATRKAASVNEVPQTISAMKIKRPSSTQSDQVALSPRTTRRNMLATELSESLRRNLLWERQQKHMTSNAVLKRRATSAMDVSEMGKDALDEEYGYHGAGW
ncbi:hypothetical protein YB2330_000652 [Saitoella coloradoensis]